MILQHTHHIAAYSSYCSNIEWHNHRWLDDVLEISDITSNAVTQTALTAASYTHSAEHTIHYSALCVDGCVCRVGAGLKWIVV